MNPIDIVLRAIGVTAVVAGMAMVGDSGKAMGADVKSGAVEATKGLDETTKSAKETEKATRDAGNAAEELKGKFDKARDISLGIAAAGAAGLILTKHLSDVAAEGDGVLQRLESILRAQNRLQDMPQITEAAGEIAERGHFSDDDELNEAAVRAASFSVETRHMADMMELAARQARTMRGEMGSAADTAEALSKAYNTGDVAPLKRSGVTISDEDIAKIEEAYALSQKLGQATFMDTVGAAIRANSVELADSLTDAQKAANDAAREMDNLQTSLGQGVQRGEKNLAGVAGRLLQIINLSPKAAQGLGEVGYYASLGATGLGTMGATGIQVYVGLIEIAKYYQTTVGGIFSLSFWAARWASFAAFGVGAWTSITTATVAAGTAAWAAIAPLLPLMLAIVAAAILASAAFYAIDKAMNAKEDKELRENIAKGDATDEARLKMVNDGRKKQGKGALTLEQMRAWENDTSGEWKDPTDKQTSDPETDIDTIKKQAADLQAGQFGAMPTMPTVPAGGAPASAPSATLPAPTVTMGGAAPVAIQYTDSNATTMGPGTRVEESERRVKQIEAQIDALQEAKANATERKKPLIEKQIKAAQKQLEAAREQVKRDEALEKKGLAQQGYDADVARTQIDIAFQSQIDALEAQLDGAKENQNKERIRALTLQIEQAKARQAYELAQSQAAEAGLTDAAKAKSMAEIAALKYSQAMRKAQLTADRAIRTTQDDGDARDASIRAMRAMAGGGQVGGGFGLGFSALNPAGTATGGAGQGSSNGDSEVRQVGMQQTDREFIGTFEMRTPRGGLGSLRGRIKR